MKSETNKYVVRTEKAGVFYGEIKSREGQEIVMQNVKRLWYWDGAFTLSQLAKDGVSKPQRCKFSVSVDEVTILGVIEIIPASETAQKSIESVPTWTV